MNKNIECLKRIDSKNYLTEREHKEFYGMVEKALKDFEELKEPHDEYVTKDEKYLAVREAYWCDNDDELRYGYTLWEWAGEYNVRELNYIDPKTQKKKQFKEKKYNEIMHYTSNAREKLNEEYIQKKLKIIKILMEN